MRLPLAASCLLAVPGCAVIVPAAVGVAALAPATVPVLAPSAGDGVVEVGFAHAGTDEPHSLIGGSGGAVRTLGFVGRGHLGVLAGGRDELGFYGRDRRYAIAGVDVGPAYRFGPGFVGVSVGYKVGGYPQNGQAVPLRVTALWHLDSTFTLHGSIYGGWRFDLHGERPAAVRTIGPWNTWGGDLALALGARKGLSLGATFDREDDIRVLTIHIAAMLGPGE